MHERLTPDQIATVLTCAREFADDASTRESRAKAGRAAMACRPELVGLPISPALMALFSTALIDMQANHETANAALRTRAEQAERGDVAWMIERGIGTPPRYWTGRINGTGFKCWTYDPNEGIRFARKQDAESMIQRLSIEAGSFASEHAWVDAPATKETPNA